ncbi:hypothetical protein KY289_033953 [Solanum tuberosum]|nr:hypothetical protein KY289_033953 [Solanum tuberosum]
MEYQQLLIAFCFYSLFIQQSQLTYAGKHLCARNEAFYLLQFKQGLTVDQNAFHYSCDDLAQAKTLSWNVTGDCCEWDGVTCNRFTGHVIGLDLSSSCLKGTIYANSSLTKLGHLQRLNLAFNEFNGFPLGNSISKLRRLTHLNLSDSGMEMQILPGLSNLSKLISLDLSWNYIQVGRTTFTSLLQNLTNLEVLLFDNVDAPIELPKNFPSSLRKLSLKNTNMFGSISDSQLFHLPNLQVLGLGWNPSLTGTLPNFNWSFSESILELDFSRTGIFGKVPDSIGNLHSLCYLDLSSNSLSGSIPESIGNLTAIRELTLSNNNFTGNVLSTISKLNKLVHLGLSNNHFQGSFPESIGNFTAIIELRLSGNNFTGNVPSTISKLKELVYLDLSSNHFGDSIPESIGNLTAIRELGLSDNSFTGNVPSTIGKLNNIEYLFLSSNNFEGSIPGIFTNFSELSILAFDSNNFTGSFPYSVATLTSLRMLELQNNLLTGPLPSNISGLQELQQLDLSFNYFTGATPLWLFCLPSLISLSVQDNQLTGKLPNELKSNYLEYLQYGKINLSYNKLHGEIPDWMLSMSLDRLDLSHNFLTGFEKQAWHSNYLPYLNLENNFLQGPLPLSICDMINLEFLILAQNNFSGSIPGCLVNSNSFISILDLRMNNFHGEIPRFLPTGLQYLGLYGNQLRGQVPRSLLNCTSLAALDLGNNKINDTFPIWLEKLPNLQVLILKSNLFHGSIGSLESEFPFPELRIFDLSCNGFTGTLPSNLFKSFRGNEYDMRITSIMTSVDLSSNRFEGDIPNSIGSLSSLVLLNLSHNSFRCHIPAEFAKLQALEALDLSWNRLIGEIPGPLSSLTFLEVLNLSYNHLAGRIPIGKQFNTFPNDSYCGNPDLCGFPLSKDCGNNNESPLEHDDDDDDDDDSFFMSGFTWEAVVIGYGCGMIFGLLIGGLMFLLEKPKWYVNFAEDIAQQIAAKKRTRQKKRPKNKLCFIDDKAEIPKENTSLFYHWRSARQRVPSSRYSPNDYVLLTDGEPECYEEAMEDEHKDQWIDVMQDEIKSLHENRIEQMDVKTTFLHGDLEEEIYMKQPESFKVDGKEIFVCKLRKSLYGLKQAPRQWYKKFESVMGEQGYKKTSLDHCVFVQKNSDNDFIILLLYVDDILIVGRNTSKIDELKKELCKSFAMKDLGHAKQILGEQEDVSYNLGGKESMTKVSYSSVVGSLMYLKGSSDEWLCFGASDPILKGYTDVDMAGDLDNRKSTIGYLFTFSGGAISWQSKLQKCVALFTTEAKYIATTEAGNEMIWLKRFLQELGLQQMEYVVYCDNQSAIDLIKNSMYHARTKHIDVRHYWFREEVESESFHVKKIHTSENLADMLTKTISKDKFELCKELVSMSTL